MLFGPSAHPQPHNRLSFYSVGRKSFSKAYFFFLPPPHLNEVLNLRLFIPGQIVATLSGACWTRGTAGITGRRGGSSALTPRAESHSPLGFESFQKYTQWKGGPPSPLPLPLALGSGEGTILFILLLPRKRYAGTEKRPLLKAMWPPLKGTQTAWWDCHLPQTHPGFTSSVSLQPSNSDMDGSKYPCWCVCVDTVHTHTSSVLGCNSIVDPGDLPRQSKQHLQPP